MKQHNKAVDKEKLTMKKQVKILENPYLLLLWTVGVLFTTISYLAIMIDVMLADAAEDASVYGLMLLILILYLIVMICNFYKCYVVIKLTEDQIIYKPAFRKAQVMEYKYYPVIYKAHYYQGPEGLEICKITFIVMTWRNLSEYQLTHINDVAGSKDVIKIKYSDKVFDQLCSVMPDKHVRKLKMAFPGKELS